MKHFQGDCFYIHCRIGRELLLRRLLNTLIRYFTLRERILKKPRHIVARRFCSFASYTCLILWLVTLFGCGDGRPKRVPVSGKVLIDGQPLSYGIVRFVPADDRPSAGILDQDGHFTLTCYEQSDGAVVGNHQVAVSADERLSESRVRWHAPKKYSDYKLSGLRQEILDTNNDVTINLTWDGSKPFDEIDDAAEIEPKLKKK
jgi:hypothetical protein